MLCAASLLLFLGSGVSAQYTWNWSWGLNSSDPEDFRDVEIDPADGSIYTAGEAQNSNITIGPLVLFDLDQGILAKFDTQGNLLWYVPIGGADDETAENVSVAPNGTVYVTGAFTSNCYFYNQGSSSVVGTLTSFSGSKDIYVAAYTPTGQFLWAQQFGNGNDELSPYLAADATGVTLLASYKGAMTVSSQSTSAALNASRYHVFLTRLDLNGNFQWLLSGGSASADDISTSLATDGTRIYAGYACSLGTHKWYNGAGTQIASFGSGTTFDQYLSAFTTAGAWSWGTYVTDPTANLPGVLNVAVGCGAVYVSGAASTGSSLPGGTAASGGNGNNYFYLARLDPATGAQQWTKWGTSDNGGATFNGRDLCIGRYGQVVVGGTYEGTVTYAGQTLNASNMDVFVMTVYPDGTLRSMQGISTGDDQYISGLAADKEGGVAICGYYESNIAIPGHALSGPNNLNAFIAYAQQGLREPEHGIPSYFTPPASMCYNNGAVALSTWTLAHGAGNAVSVTGVNGGTTNSSAATGAPNGAGATLPGGAGSIVLDLGTTVPAGENIGIVWRLRSGATPTLEVYASSDLITATILSPTLSTTRTTFVQSTIQATIPTRYVLIYATSGGAVDIDAVRYAFGTETGGAWSGPGVSSTQFDPTGQSGTVAVSYSVGSGTCQSTTTRNIAITPAAQGGTLTTTTAGTLCPGNNSGTLSLSGQSGTITGWASSTNGFGTSVGIVNTSPTQSFSNLTQTTAYRATVTQCGTTANATLTIPVGDTDPPVITCPSNITVNSGPGMCGANVNYTAPTATDNCTATPTVAPTNATQASGSFFPVGTTVVPWKATDAAGNTSSCSFSITVIDAEMPVITCPANINVNADPGTCGAIVTYAMPTGTDNCSGTVMVTNLSAAQASGSFFPVGVSAVQLKATDSAGNASFCFFTITVVDNIPPAISCPTNISATAQANTCGATVTYAMPTATDNCSGTTIVRTAGPASGSVFPVGTTTVTHRATDMTGNSMDCSFTVTVSDVQAPLMACPVSIVTNVQPGLCGAAVSYAMPTGSDNCSAVTVTLTAGLASGSVFPVGTTTVTHRGTDAAGNSSDCSFTVTVNDNQVPAITCPSDIVVNAPIGACSAVVTYTAPVGTDNCSGATTARIAGPASGSTFPLGTTVVTHRVTDSAGNSVTCSFNVTVKDVQPPSLTCPGDITLNAQPGICGATATYALPVASDLCGSTTLTRIAGPASGSFFPVGTTTVSHTATDAAGNTNTCSFNVIVVDDQFPAITCPGPITTNNEPGLCGAAVTYAPPVATDNCSIAGTVLTAGFASGSTFPVGNTTVSYETIDGAGHTANCSFTVTVIDTAAPVISCPGDISVNTETGTCGAHVSYVLPIATDNCGGTVTVVPVNSAYAPGSLFPIGTTTVQLRATDVAGNSRTCSFTITVIDTIAPGILCPGNITTTVEAGTCGAHVNYTLPVATDNCGGTVTVAPVNSAYAPGSLFPAGSTSVQLRATDAAGNSTDCSFTVTVNDNAPPSITCPGDISTNAEAGLCGAHVTYALPVATDDCGGLVTVVAVNSAHASGNIFPVGTTTVQLRATDVSGNSSTCSFTVTVVDAIAPVINGCPGNITLNADASCTAIGSWTVPTVTDNCSGASITRTGGPAPGSSFPLGVTTVTYRALDAAGNITGCSFTVTVVDVTAPVINNCPGNITVNAGPACTATATWVVPTVSDNCSGAGIARSAGPAPGSTFPVGITTIVYTATDAAGNTASCSFTVTVADVTPPVIAACPNNISVNADAGCSAIANWTAPTVSDNCNGATITRTAGPAPGSTFPIGATTITYTATDAAGNTSTCSFTVTVTDVTAPVINACPGNISVNADASCSAIATWNVPTVSDNCSGATITRTAGAAPGSTFPIGNTTITYTATDAAGNTSTCSFTVTVVDVTAPVISGCPSDITANADASCSGIATWTTPAVSDNCSGATIVQLAGPASGGSFPIGVTTITYKATDAAGNTSTCSFTVTVVDVTAPVITGCPGNITMNAGATCSAIANWNAPTVSDNCSGAGITRTAGPAPGSTFPIGVTTITYTATDAAGNTATCSFTVTVVDVTAPVITGCPTNISVNADATCSAIANWTAPTVSDNCSGASITRTAGPAPGSTFPIGITTITYTATDAAGNTSTCSFTVTVTDVTAPVIDACPSNISVNADATCSAIATWNVPTVSDNCSGATITRTTGPAPGSTFSIGNTTITYTATDAAGNTSICSFTVTVVDTIAPVISSCPGDITVNADAACSGIANWTAPTVSDNCSGATIIRTAGAAPGSTFPIGVTAITYEATDAAGNTSTCSFIVTVMDVTAPEINGCPGDITVYADASCSAPASWNEPTSNDNCGNATIIRTSGPAPGSTLPIGTTNIAYTATDDAGNTTMCLFTVTVVDSIAPVITDCPGDIVINGNGSCTATATWTAPMVSDNCGAATITRTAGPASGSTFAAGTTTIVYTASDDAGNNSTCSFTVTVIDATAPTISCPNDTSLAATTGDCGAILDYTLPEGSDNCSAVVGVAPQNPAFAPNSSFPIGTSHVVLVAMDDAGNTSTCTFAVVVMPGPIALSYPSNSYCQDATSIAPNAFSPSGGTFSADAGLNIDPNSGVVQGPTSAPGDHTIHYRSAGPCPQETTFVLTLVAPPDAGGSSILSFCSTDAPIALIDHLTGTPDAGGSWSGPSPVISGLFDPATMNAGTYTYTVSATAPCTAASASIDVGLVTTHDASFDFDHTDYCATEVDPTPTHAENGGQYTSTSGLDIEANTGTVHLASSLPGTYIITHSINGACGDTATRSITVHALLAANAGSDTAVCDLSTSLQAIGNGSWSGPAGVTFSDANDANSAVSVAAEGSYTLTWTVTDGLCSRMDDVTIAFHATPVADAGPNGVICGYDTQLQAQGTGVWSGPAGVTFDDPTDPQTGVHVTAQGLYTLQWTVSNGPCVAVSAVNYTFFTPVSSAAGPDQSVCATTTQMQAVGVGTWNSPTGGVIIDDPTDPHTMISAPSSGTYLLNWQLVNGTCVGNDDVLITFHPTVQADAGPDQAVCGFQAELAAVGDGTWTLPGGILLVGPNSDTATAQADAAGSYTLTWNVTNGECSSSDDVVISFYDPVTVEAGPDQQVCGMNAQLTASGPGTWSVPGGVHVSATDDPQATVTADAAGTYQLTWSAVNGACSASDDLSITFLPIPDAAFSYTTTALCTGGDDVLPTMVTLGGSYTATPAGLAIDGATGLIDVSASTVGSYSVTYSLSGSCPAQSSVVITVANTADAAWTAPAELCASSGALDLSTFVTGTPGGTWSGTGVDGSVFDPAGLSGLVTITYTAGSGTCAANAGQTIIVDAMPVSDAGADQALCALDATLEAVPAGGTGTWSGPADVVFTDLHDPHTAVTAGTPGIHTLVWTVEAGMCQSSDEVSLQFFDPAMPIWANAGEDQMLDIRDHTDLSGMVAPGASAQWTAITGTGLFEDATAPVTSVAQLAVGNNLLVLTATIGTCLSASDTVVVHVNDLFIPQGYSPNGDGVNDTFSITGIQEFPGNTIEVFDRWGKRVFRANDYDNSWDGRSHEGNVLANDTYFYLIQLTPDRLYQGYVVIKR